MIDSRLGNLEGRVERLANLVGATRRQIADLLQKVWQVSSTPTGGGGGGGLVQVQLPTGIGSGALGAPSAANDAIVCVLGTTGHTTTGGTVITVYSEMTRAIPGPNKTAWFTPQDDGNLYLAVADC